MAPRRSVKSHQFYDRGPLTGAQEVSALGAYGGSTGSDSQDEIDRSFRVGDQLTMAEALQAGGSSTAPVSSVWEGLARVGQGAVGGYLADQAKQKIEDREKNAAKNRSAILAALLTEGSEAQNLPGGGPPSTERIIIPETLGGIEAALAMAAKLGDPDQGPLVQELTLTQFEQDQATDAAAMLRAQEVADAKLLRAQKIEDLEWEAANPDSSPPSSAMKNFAHLQKLQEEFPPIVGSDGELRDSPEVLRFIEFVRKSHLLDLGGSVVAYDPANPGSPIPVAPITLPPEAETGYIAEKGEAGATGTATGQSNYEQYETAIAAPGNQQRDYDLMNHLRTSDATTGLGAEFINNINRVKAFFGSYVANNQVADTELLDVMMGSEVFPLIQSLGIGARGMDTPAEREFMRKVLTGSLQLNQETLLRMAQMRIDESNKQISDWNSRVEAGELDNFFEFSGITKALIPSYTPSTVEPESAEDVEGAAPTITPEEWEYHQEAYHWAINNPDAIGAAAIIDSLTNKGLMPALQGGG